MLETLIVGVDVSKLTLDICFQPGGMTLQITNDLAGFKKFLHLIKQTGKADDKVLVIMEHTGQYSFRLEKFLRSHEIGYCKIAALQIKRSLGVMRGKTDRIDAQRIAEYGWLRRDALVADVPLQAGLSELRSLLSLRGKLVRDRAGYITRLKEMIASGTCTSCCFIGKTQQQLIHHFTTKIKQTEARIKVIINTNRDLKKTNDLLQSIKGVGWIIAAYMIGCTDNFKRFKDARKFNCYAGLAPFKMESGTSIAFRARISHLANKEAKSLLNLAASCAIRCNPELKTYYRRRVAEGKRKMSCLNIIRSKIVGRMFAVVKRQSPYEQRLIAA
jgi:transposase